VDEKIEAFLQKEREERGRKRKKKGRERRVAGGSGLL